MARDEALGAYHADDARIAVDQQHIDQAKTPGERARWRDQRDRDQATKSQDYDLLQAAKAQYRKDLAAYVACHDPSSTASATAGSTTTVTQTATATTTATATVTAGGGTATVTVTPTATQTVTETTTATTTTTATETATVTITVYTTAPAPERANLVAAVWNRP